jgi:hypothetical protein
MPAPLNNQNALKHGVSRSRRLARKGLRARKLPKGFKYVAGEASRYASALHAEVEACLGEVSREMLETIEAAAAWHQHGLYTLRVLRVDHDSLKPETRVQLSSEIAKSIQKRADQVKSLRLGERRTIPHIDPALFLPADPDSAPDSEPQPEAMP